MEVDADQLRDAVEGLHNCRARLREVVPVVERFRGETVWEGIVHIFDVEGHPSASRCYAWSSQTEGSERRRFYAVLHVPPVVSAVDAVRAAIVHDYRTSQARH